MAGFPLKKLLLPSAILTGVVFSSLTVPLAFFGSEPLDIRFGEESIFRGQLKEVATPYIGFVALLSVGAGVASVAIAGWQQSSRSSGQIEAKLSGLQQQLQAKETELEAALLSETRLEAAGLSFFLQDDATPKVQTPQVQVSSPPVKPQPTATRSVQTGFHPVVISTDMPVVEARTFPAEPQAAQTVTMQSVVSPLAAAQAFLSFSRASVPESVEGQTTVEAAPAKMHLKDLQEQLKQILSQVETLQGSLQPEQAVTPHPVHQPQYVVNPPVGNVEQLNQRFHPKPQWIQQSAVS